MAKLIYAANASLDGYVADPQGAIDWAVPDQEVFSAVVEFERGIGTYLYGRRMYETMVHWETAPIDDTQPPAVRDHARLWRAADKLVFSRTLTQPLSALTRIEPDFDPDDIRRLKESSDRDLTIGGPELASKAFAAGLVDECQLLLVPILVGGGTRALPHDVRVGLELLHERRFTSGVVELRYRICA